MANYATKYVKRVDDFLSSTHTKSEIDDFILIHLNKISFFQHERLIHLLVTILFAIMDIIMLSIFFITLNTYCAILMFFFTLLLIPYIFHYYFLENSIHKMYEQYDRLKDIK